MDILKHGKKFQSLIFNFSGDELFARFVLNELSTFQKPLHQRDLSQGTYNRGNSARTLEALFISDVW